MALAPLPDETVIDGEVVALDASGRPSFNTLQNQGSAKVQIIYYLFDVLILDGRKVMSEPLSTRRDLLRSHILPKLGEPVRHCPELNASLADVIESVRAAGLEGVAAKRLDGAYEPGSRSGAWRKMRLNQAQEFVIGGYTLGGKNFDAVIFGCYEAGRLRYVGQTRSASHRHSGSNCSGGSAGWRSRSVRAADGASLALGHSRQHSSAKLDRGETKPALRKRAPNSCKSRYEQIFGCHTTRRCSARADASPRSERSARPGHAPRLCIPFPGGLSRT
jgi:hypothetical protein